MPRPDRRLQFAIQFARTDLEALRPGDWLNLQNDFGDFLHLSESHKRAHAAALSGRMGFVAWPFKPPKLKDFFEHPRERFLALQTDVKKVLNGIAVMREDYEACLRGEPPNRSRYPLALPEIRATYWLFWDTKKPSGPSLLHAEGSAHDMFLLTLMFLLAQDASRVRRCVECGGIFYRVRHQRFCSPTCRNRTNTRHFREIHGKQAVGSQAARPKLKRRRRDATSHPTGIPAGS